VPAGSPNARIISALFAEFSERGNDPDLAKRLSLLSALVSERFLGGDDYFPRVRQAGLPASDRFVRDLQRWIGILEPWNWSARGESPDHAVTPDLLEGLHGLQPGRKESGAYFTAPDVTAYITANTIAPWVLDGFRVTLHNETLSAGDLISRNVNLQSAACEWIRLEADDDEVGQVCHRLSRIRILDPTCGSGAFLLTAAELLEGLWLAALERVLRIGVPEAVVGMALMPAAARTRAIRKKILETNLFGVDLDSVALDLCRRRLQLYWAIGGRMPVRRELPSPRLAPGNAVAGFDWRAAFSNVMRDSEFDVVLGNPPFVASGSVDYQPQGFDTGRCRNVYAWVVEQSLRLLTTRGRLGMVLPLSAVSGPDYQPLIDLYLQHDCWISAYSNRPAKLFAEAEQRLAILLTGPSSKEPQVRMSGYHHWYDAERPSIFEKLRYTPTPLWEGRPAKLGSKTAVSAFQKLLGAGSKLEAWEASCSEHGVWLHDGPTYWVRALPFQPNAGSETAASSHYRFIPAADEPAAHALAAILSSSTFYFWFKAISNCRDLSRKEWESFPVGELPKKARKRLAELGAELAQKLRETAQVRTRKYPRGAVVYEEYYPAQAWEVIDRIDGVLAKHYGFSKAERVYIRDLDLRYRMGQRDAGK
jgi:hypothetical protein